MRELFDRKKVKFNVAPMDEERIWEAVCEPAPAKPARVVLHRGYDLYGQKIDEVKVDNQAHKGERKREKYYNLHRLPQDKLEEDDWDM